MSTNACPKCGGGTDLSYTAPEARCLCPKEERWITRMMVDDRRGRVPSGMKVQYNYLCLEWHGDEGIPFVVSAGPVGYEGWLCLNKVYMLDGRLHISAEATYHLEREQLYELKEKGFLTIKTFERDYHFQLIACWK
jgi:hypothetical protein